MKVLITGAAGFVGRHLVAELAAHNHEVAAFCLPGETPPPEIPVHHGSVAEADDLEAALDRFRPDGCVHLAGVSSVPRSWAAPAETFRTNLLGTLYLLESVRRRPGLRCLIVTSSQIYGAGGDDRPLDETTPPRPASPYAISKAAADQLALAWAHRFSLPVLTARPTNHIGPGQSPEFVVASLALQLARISLGVAAPPVRAGNLESVRDFLDVRDVVRGYRLLLERGRAGEAYHLASGREYRIADLWERLCAIAGLHPPVEAAPELWRPADRGPRLDWTRIRTHTGWLPSIPIEETLRAIYDDARRRVTIS
ncbi:MAG: GDP-mannose 4,6-dehydratase [Kiritimatiellae bacterium]|nr:GDP-mannose 4,6-dehydratase [Kiritimatiellia bacterium]